MTVVHKKEQCPQGHKYTEENLYIDKVGNRHCRTCRRDRMRVRREPFKGVGQGGHNLAKTTCAKGHAYDEENTIKYKKPNGRFARHCRTCERLNGKVQNIKRYGITIEQFESLLELQDGKCAICKGKFWDEVSSPHIDHDHTCCSKQISSCGKCIRGLLCRGCNQLLGVAKDDIETLKAAMNYLGLGTLSF